MLTSAVVHGSQLSQIVAMIDSLLALIAIVFTIAGFVKGVIGLGLPTVAIGLLAVAMTPVQALTIVIIPAIVTNIWQTFAGPYLPDIVRRLWPLMIGTVIGIWACGDLMIGPYARYGSAVLGVLLIVYSTISLRKVQFTVPPSREKAVGGAVGLVTGAVAAATGVQVIPSMPYMQSIGMEKNELVQALGVFFTTATLAQAFNLTSAGLLNASTALPGVIAMVAAFTGMFVGQAVRTRMEAETFRKWFLIALLLLGLYLIGTTIYILRS